MDNNLNTRLPGSGCISKIISLYYIKNSKFEYRNLKQYKNSNFQNSKQFEKYVYWNLLCIA